MSTIDTSVVLPEQPAKRKLTTWLVTGAITLLVIGGLATGVMLTKREASNQAAAASAPAAQVIITAAGLDTPDLQVKKGQSVEWVSQDTAEHQLALSSDVSQAPGFGLDIQFGQGQNYVYVFDKPGTYYYYDSLHPTQLRGKITVTDQN
jgi:plastocyanin